MEIKLNEKTTKEIFNKKNWYFEIGFLPGNFLIGFNFWINKLGHDREFCQTFSIPFFIMNTRFYLQDNGQIYPPNLSV